MLQHWKERNDNTKKEMTEHRFTAQLRALFQVGELTQMKIESLKREISHVELHTDILVGAVT